MSEISIPVYSSKSQATKPWKVADVIPLRFAGETDAVDINHPDKTTPDEKKKTFLEKFIYVVSFKWLFDGLVFAFKNLFNVGDDTCQKLKVKSEQLSRELDEERSKLAETTDQLKHIPPEVLQNNQAFQELSQQRRANLQEKLSTLQQSKVTPPEVVLPNPLEGLVPLKATEVKKAPAAEQKRSPLITDKLISQAAQGNFSLEIPVESDIQYKKSPHALLNLKDSEIQDKLGKWREAQISTLYGIDWSQEKVMRDILQNFADGHGGTLEGVKIDIGPKHDGVYTVKISGKGEYNHKMLEGLGRTGKLGEDRQVGRFGEGAKMAAMIMLRDKLAESIAFRSNNWRYEFDIQNVDLGEHMSPELFRKLTQTEPLEGNTVEFTTKDPKVLKALVRAVDYFYHPGNPDFMNPTFENDLFGFKFHGLREKGNLYLVNQRNEYKSVTEGKAKLEKSCEQITFWTKTELDSSGMKKDRDRSDLDYHELRNDIFSHPKLFSSLSDQELVDLIVALKPLWNNSAVEAAMGPRASMTSGRLMLHQLVELAATRKIGLVLPEKERKCYLADNLSLSSDEVRQYLQRQGFILVPADFKEIGIQSAKSYWDVRSAHKPVEPSKNDVIRLNILKEVARLYATSSATNLPMDEMTLKNQIAKPLFLFDGTDKTNEEGEEKVLGEHAKTHIWIERNHLRQDDFNSAVATYLHELTHNIGRGHDTDFAIALTKWLGAMQEAMVEGPEAWANWQRLQDLKAVWGQAAESEIQAKETQAA